MPPAAWSESLADPFSHLRGTQLFPHNGVWPKVDPSAFIAPGAIIMGDVEIGPEATIWPGVVIRGDVNYVRIGARTNLQDGTVVHVSRDKYPCVLGAGITVGHKALLHACRVEDGAFIGMSSTVMDGAVVEGGGMVAAGALVTPGKRVKSGEIWAGSPARFMRDISESEKAYALESVEVYCRLGREYRDSIAAGQKPQPEKPQPKQFRSRGFRGRP